jgi:type II secretory pathway pseudopilin PulG
MEALLAVSIMAIAGGAIMLALASSVQTTQVSVETSIARGIAEQLIDEVIGQRYAAAGAGPYQYPLVANSWELNGQGRERYDDTDDYNGFAAQPVENIQGQELGQGDAGGYSRHPNFRLPAGYFSTWREEIEVYYVDATDHSIRLNPGVTSDYRAVEVRILRDNPDGTQRDLANLRRVYAYVPAPQ